MKQYHCIKCWEKGVLKEKWNFKIFFWREKVKFFFLKEDFEIMETFFQRNKKDL